MSLIERIDGKGQMPVVEVLINSPKIAKQIEALKKKHVELLAYDEKLRHYADMRIALDLDDGVKVNYGKFGDLLAEVKAARAQIALREAA
jgi:hypothetical protein